MLNHILGEANFKQGLINYLNTNKFANAVHNDLWKALTIKNDSFEDVNVKEIMDTWTTQAGFPVVTATKNYETNEVHLSQVLRLKRCSTNND